MPDRKRGALNPLSPSPLTPRVIRLSRGTLTRLHALFVEAETETAARWLMEGCGANLPGCERATANSLERLRYAALKLSEGDLVKLRAAIHEAQVDWRDLLVSAGFANDLTAHLHWRPIKRTI